MNNLDIIVVNWNAGEQLGGCLSSVVSCRFEKVRLKRVVVVDNASTDNSLEGLERLPLPLEIIRNSSNLGFAAACNQGARGSTSDYILFLNPDTLLEQNSLDQPVSFMDKPENEKFGIVGIQLVDEKGVISRTCTRFPTPRMLFYKMTGLDHVLPRLFPSYFMSEWGHGHNREVDHVIGAFYLVRRSLFEALRGFDERFFVYMEDLDFSLRARSAGRLCYFLADARAFHRGGGTSERVKATRLFYSLRSRILYAFKHFSRGNAILVLTGTLLLEPLSRLALCTAHHSLSQLYETIVGYARLWRSMPEILKTAFKEGPERGNSPYEPI